MLAGGGPEFQIICEDNKEALRLFSQFKLDYDGNRKASGSEQPTIKVSGQDVYLNKREGERWEAYSRKFKQNDGSWRVVQILRRDPPIASRAQITDYSISIFDGNGRRIISVSSPPCGDRLFGLFTSESASSFIKSTLLAAGCPELK